MSGWERTTRFHGNLPLLSNFSLPFHVSLFLSLSSIPLAFSLSSHLLVSSPSHRLLGVTCSLFLSLFPPQLATRSCHGRKLFIVNTRGPTSTDRETNFLFLFFSLFTATDSHEGIIPFFFFLQLPFFSFFLMTIPKVNDLLSHLGENYGEVEDDRDRIQDSVEITRGEHRAR